MKCIVQHIDDWLIVPNAFIKVFDTGNGVSVSVTYNGFEEVYKAHCGSMNAREVAHKLAAQNYIDFTDSEDFEFVSRHSLGPIDNKNKKFRKVR